MKCVGVVRAVGYERRDVGEGGELQEDDEGKVMNIKWVVIIDFDFDLQG